MVPVAYPAVYPVDLALSSPRILYIRCYCIVADDGVQREHGVDTR